MTVRTTKIITNANEAESPNYHIISDFNYPNGMTEPSYKYLPFVTSFEQ